MDIVKNITGDCKVGAVDNADPSVLPSYQIRRSTRLYKAYFQDTVDGIPFKSCDVSAIAIKFLDSWDGVEMSSNTPRRRSFIGWRMLKPTQAVNVLRPTFGCSTRAIGEIRSPLNSYSSCAVFSLSIASPYTRLLLSGYPSTPSLCKESFH